MTDAASHVVSLGALDHVIRGPQGGRSGNRLAVVAALVAHAGLFAVTWPTASRAVAPPEEPVLRPVPIIDVVPRPPEPPPRPELQAPGVEPDLPAPVPPPVVLLPRPAELTPVEPVPVAPAGLESIPPPPFDAAPPPDEPVISGVHLEPPRVLHRVQPRYTEAARHVGLQGVVVLELLIGTDGRIDEATVLRGLPLGLSQSALEAARQWRFEASTLNGRPVKVRYHLTVRFALQ